MMRFFLVKAPPILTLDIKLGNLCNPEHTDDFLYNDLIEFMGKQSSLSKILGARYNNEIYFYMSRGILNPNIMETIPNEQVLQSVMLAPSIILTEAWESQEFKSFYTSIFNNLFEDTAEEKKSLEIQTTVPIQHSSTHSGSDIAPLSHLPECFGYGPEKWNAEKYHYRWNITREEVEEELDR
jgi:hypothetical protein